ncbi:MAG: hypothetical protein ACO3IB_14835 [Phycisphaerales bacterium]
MQPPDSVPTGMLFDAVGWVPALVFPIATWLQLGAIVARRSAEGVSVPAWLLFAIANTCLYFYTEKHGELESVLGTLLTAALNLCIVGAALWYRRGARKGAETPTPP